MTVPISYPGVYITEIPSGSRTIVGVATSITAFVGAASRGPADVPVTIFSFADFERTFGGLSRTSGLGYAVRDFYQNGGGEALIVRVVHEATADETEHASAATATAALDPDGLKLEAIGPGTWGNALQVEVSVPSDEDPDAQDVAAGQGQGITTATYSPWWCGRVRQVAAGWRRPISTSPWSTARPGSTPSSAAPGWSGHRDRDLPDPAARDG